MIFGSNVPPQIQARASDDVIIRGYVADVAEVFDSCRVFVAPLLTGAGMKGKVLDCIAAGIPSVLSPIAAEASVFATEWIPLSRGTLMNG